MSFSRRLSRKITVRVKYTFPVTGHLPLEASYEFTFRSRWYRINADSQGFLQSIAVTVRIDPKEHPPSFEPSTQPGVKMELKVPREPALEGIRQEMRNAEGLLALYGLRGISTNQFTTDWLPESAEEKELLKLNNFSISHGSMRDLPCRPVPFDLVARSLLMADAADAAEVPLSFYRKGCIDMEEMRYIDAIYDFYFVLETLFSGGKTKNAAVKEEFLRSPEVLAAITTTLPTLHQIPNRTFDEEAHIAEHYREKSPSDIVDHLVRLRGFLHHHAPRHPKAWHPEGHSRYRIDALLLQEVAYHICFDLFAAVALTPESELLYREIADLHEARMEKP